MLLILFFQSQYVKDRYTDKMSANILKASRTKFEKIIQKILLQKGGVPATPSGTATLLRLSPSYRFYPRPILAVTDFRHPQLPWLDGRCVQGPGTYSPHHG